MECQKPMLATCLFSFNSRHTQAHFAPKMSLSSLGFFPSSNKSTSQSQTLSLSLLHPTPASAHAETSFPVQSTGRCPRREACRCRLHTYVEARGPGYVCRGAAQSSDPQGAQLPTSKNVARKGKIFTCAERHLQPFLWVPFQSSSDCALSSAPHHVVQDPVCVT